MLRQPMLSITDAEIEDHSMRIVEYALAFVAALAAGVLAFIR